MGTTDSKKGYKVDSPAKRVTKPVESPARKGKGDVSDKKSASSSVPTTTVTTTKTTTTSVRSAVGSAKQANGNPSSLPERRQQLLGEISRAIHTLPTEESLEKVLSYVKFVDKESKAEL